MSSVIRIVYIRMVGNLIFYVVYENRIEEEIISQTPSFRKSLDDIFFRLYQAKSSFINLHFPNKFFCCLYGIDAYLIGNCKRLIDSIFT